MTTTIDDLHYAQVLWDYHQVDLPPVQSDIGLVLGSHDLGVVDVAVRLYRVGLFPIVVMSGSNSPTTIERFPRGEAVHYAEYAEQLGIPSAQILKETRATNTSENFTFAEKLLDAEGIALSSAVVVSKPYMQRRALLTARKVWPGVSITLACDSISLPSYIESIGDAKLVIDMLVGDTQRIVVYGAKGFAEQEELPSEVDRAYRALAERGFTSRMLLPAD